MPDNYYIALFLHIVGVFGVAGSAISFWIAMSVMRRIGTIREMRSWATMAVWTDRGFPLAAVLVIAAGIFMVEDRWTWDAGWMNTSLIALIAMGVGGGLLMKPRVARIHDAVTSAPDGPVGDDIRRLVSDPILWATLHAFTLGLFAIIWNMTTKPGDSQAGTVILLAFVIGALSALPRAMRQR